MTRILAALLAATLCAAPALAQPANPHAGHTMPAPTSLKVGTLAIEAPWARATPNGAKVAGGFLRITNTGTEADTLVSGTATFSERVEIHEMAVTDGIMRMRPLAEGLTIKPGETIELKPGSFHVMFMGLKQQLKEGESLKGTLTFKKAGTINIDFAVKAIAAQGGAMQHKH